MNPGSALSSVGCSLQFHSRCRLAKKKAKRHCAALYGTLRARQSKSCILILAPDYFIKSSSCSAACNYSSFLRAGLKSKIYD